MRFPRVVLAIAIAGAFILGLTPGAGAHAATNSVATVAGEVTWPASTATTPFTCSSVHPAGNTVTNPTIAGLPLAGPYRDRCFNFGSIVISSAGTWEQTATKGDTPPTPSTDPTHVTDFGCTSRGISGANGLPAGVPDATFLQRADDPEHLGAFQGRYNCTVSGGSDPRRPVNTPTGEQIFFGMSKGNAIAFSGTAPLLMLAAASVDNLSSPPTGWTAMSHTLTCAGRVDPLEVDTVNNTVVKAAVALDCTIA